MLKQRILTALILIPIFVLLVLLLPPIPFCILTGLVVLWAAWEWSFFLGIKKLPFNFLYLLVMLLVLLISFELPIVEVLYFAAGWWIFALILVALYPRGSDFWGKSILLRALMGFFVLVPCWLALNYIRNAENGTYSILFLFVLIWGADTGAYFVGRKWGKNKMVPAVSPGKSWQGFAGALGVTLLIAIIALLSLKLPYYMWPAAFIVSTVTVLSSVLGDLFESMLKRNVGLKDSGRLLPGHGGILDRIDSLTAAAPFFAVSGILVGKFFQ